MHSTSASCVKTLLKFCSWASACACASMGRVKSQAITPARFGCESQGGMTGATAGVKYKRIRLHGRQMDHQIEIRAGGMYLARAIIGGDASETLLHMFLYIVRVLAPIHALAAS